MSRQPARRKYPRPRRRAGAEDRPTRRSDRTVSRINTAAGQSRSGLVAPSQWIELDQADQAEVSGRVAPVSFLSIVGRRAFSTPPVAASETPRRPRHHSPFATAPSAARDASVVLAPRPSTRRPSFQAVTIQRNSPPVVCTASTPVDQPAACSVRWISSAGVGSMGMCRTSRESCTPELGLPPHRGGHPVALRDSCRAPLRPSPSAAAPAELVGGRGIIPHPGRGRAPGRRPERFSTSTTPASRMALPLSSSATRD
jgi:hypothetical protein